MRRTIFLLLIVFTFIVSTVQPVFGVGIGKYSTQQNILFQSGLEATYSFYLFDDQQIHCSIEGDLAEYATVKDPNPDGGPRNVEILLSLPEYLEPGSHDLYIVATQASRNSAATVGGIASVKTGVTVFALYPGKRPIITQLYSNDLNVNEKANFGIELRNNGEEVIANAKGTVTIFDQNNNVIAILPTNSASVGAFETLTLTTVLDASVYNLSLGTYKAVGNLTFDDEIANQSVQANFIVGKLNVDITETTKEVIVNATNKYYITLESDWSGDIDNVYAKITMPNGKVIKTPNVDMIKPGQGSKATAQIEAYMETNDLSIGTYDVDVTLYYKGLTKSNKITLNVIDGKAPEIEKPKIITPTTIFIGLGIIVILFVAAYFLIFRKGGNGPSPSYKNSNNSDVRPPVSDSSIRPPSL